MFVFVERQTGIVSFLSGKAKIILQEKQWVVSVSASQDPRAGEQQMIWGRSSGQQSVPCVVSSGNMPAMASWWGTLLPSGLSIWAPPSAPRGGLLSHHGGCLAQLQNATVATRSRGKKAEMGNIPAMALRYLTAISTTQSGEEQIYSWRHLSSCVFEEKCKQIC